jgi:carboxyl-terminal processing protease
LKTKNYLRSHTGGPGQTGQNISINMTKKKLQIWLPLLFSITMIAGMFLGYKMRDGLPGKSFFYMENRRPIQEVLDIIHNKYVDSVDINRLSDTAIQALLQQLDPHSQFIPPLELQAVNEEISGNFFGIGVEFNMFNDSIHVVNVLKDGPAFKAGLQTGDIILKANDSILSGKKVSVERIRKNLRGPLGSPVNVTIERDRKQQTVTIERGIIPLYSLDAGYMIDSSIGFIRLNKFSKQTYREFMTALESLKKKGMKQLILDLRGNGGGVLDEAVEIADEFLSGDKLITYTEGLHVKKREYRCRREGQFETGALVILADEGTASASEVLLGAVQDWDRATIIGRRTFGKGLVQEQFDLSNKGALRLTVARYYTPVGRSIQRSYSNGQLAYFDEISSRYHNGGMVSADSVKNDTTKLFASKAGKKIYGGGGISPDYFVASDTSRLDPLTAKLFVKGLLSDFGYLYYMKNRGLSNTYKTSTQFSRDFRLSENDWMYFQQLAAKDSLDVSRLPAVEKNYLMKALKSSVARQLFRTEGYVEVMNADDKSLLKAIEILKRK